MDVALEPGKCPGKSKNKPCAWKNPLKKKANRTFNTLCDDCWGPAYQTNKANKRERALADTNTRDAASGLTLIESGLRNDVLNNSNDYTIALSRAKVNQEK